MMGERQVEQGALFYAFSLVPGARGLCQRWPEPTPTGAEGDLRRCPDPARPPRPRP